MFKHDMAIKFGDIELRGPFSRLDELEDLGGLFVVLCNEDNRFKRLDVRIAKSVQTEVAKALAEPGWSKVCKGKLRVAVLYSFDETQLESIKQLLSGLEFGQV
ncbi:MAG: hypothetical protein C0507_14890 [Cyanobacteria bacterium PR.3.49]|nr:hypothetical protein [Cyanobacteria bacterium PR.3.49]